MSVITRLSDVSGEALAELQRWFELHPFTIPVTSLRGLIPIAKLVGYPSDAAKALFGDGTWKTVSSVYGGEDSLYTVASSGSTLTVNFTNGATQDITLTADCTFTFSGAVGSVACCMVLLLRQDATGTRRVTWPASVSWLGGAGGPPVLQTARSAVDVVTVFTVDGGTTWVGFAASELNLNWQQAVTGTCTYASATTFTCSGDQTSIFTLGKKLRVTQTTKKYFVVVSASYNGSTTTTVTITGGTDYTLANAALTEVLISNQDNPDGWPGWFTFAAACTGITSDTSVTRFAVNGRVCQIALNLVGTSNATTKAITLPFTPKNVSGIQWIAPLTVKDNNIVQSTPGEVVINPNNASASVFKTTAAGAWTASLAWFAIGGTAYEF